MIVRVDFNVPLKDGKVESDKRLKESLPTIKYLKEKGAKVILMSHLGRPDGKRSPEFSLRPVADALAVLLGSPVSFAEDCVGEPVETAVAALEDGDVLLLENLRFHAEEEANDPAFAKQLAAVADVYVNDAFGSAHRAHASTEGITQFVPQAASGYLMKKELDYLGGALAEPKRPFVAIIGGSKVSGKIDVIKHLLPQVDKLLIGGGMTFTFLKSQASRSANRSSRTTSWIWPRAYWPKPVTRSYSARTSSSPTSWISKRAPWARPRSYRPKTFRVIGRAWTQARRTIAAFRKIILGAGTVIWNGPGRGVRDRRLRQGHDRRGRGARGGHRQWRDHHHRRRRLGIGGEEGRRRFQGFARLHGRRRFARVPRGQSAPGRGRADR